MSTRKINKAIRKEFRKICIELFDGKVGRIMYRNDKWSSGNRRKVFKSYGYDGLKKVYERLVPIANEIDNTYGEWEVYNGHAVYVMSGDGSVAGMYKRIPKDQWTYNI